MTEQEKKPEVKFSEKMLLQLARDKRSTAYAKYSFFTVGAAVRGGSGKVYFGCNVENSSYPVGVCAERVAVACAIAHGESRIEMLALAGGYKNEPPDGKIQPCGMCLQFLSEFMKPESRIFIADGESGYNEFTLSEIFPHAFTLKDHMRD
ncbi:MAG: cytidine deaminase [bacterium]|nr:cytidine deaminase [bacterium]